MRGKIIERERVCERLRVRERERKRDRTFKAPHIKIRNSLNQMVNSRASSPYQPVWNGPLKTE